MAVPVIKYPKTPRLLAVLDQLDKWKKHDVVISEKLDGSNAGISFDGPHLALQSRGHVLRGGERERQFDLFKQWGNDNRQQLFDVIGSRYVIFGEWLYAKHRIYYDNLPFWFITYDVFDKEEQEFLTTDDRRTLLTPLGLPEAPILYRGTFGKVPNFAKYIGTSKFKTADWRKHYKGPMEGTDDTNFMEGVYVKVESPYCVIGRIKIHRPEYEKLRDEHNDDWLRKPIVTNRCRVLL